MGAPNSQHVAENNNNNHTGGGFPAEIEKPSADAGKDSATHRNDTATGSLSDPAAYISLIQQYLAVFQVDNATFLADRCAAEYPTCSEIVYLQALCRYRAGQVRAARHILEVRPPQHQPPPPLPPDRSQSGVVQKRPNINSSTSTTTSNSMIQYLSAQCSYELNEYSRAEETLLRETRALYFRQNREVLPVLSMDDWILQTTPCPVPQGASGLALLGKICRKSNRKERAIQYFRMSLQLDPFLWTSFEALAEMGVQDIDAATVFGVTMPLETRPSMARALAVSDSGIAPSNILAAKTPLQPMETPTAHHHHHVPSAPSASLTLPHSTSRHHQQHQRHLAFETPGLTPIPVNASLLPAETPTHPSLRSQVAKPPQHQPAAVKRARDVVARRYYPPTPETPVTAMTRSMKYLGGLGGETSGPFHSTHHPAGRSLFLSSENKASQHHNLGPSSQEDAVMEDDLVKPADNKEGSAEKVQGILELLAVTGTAYQYLCQYRCRDALQVLSALPPRQLTTAWVLHQQGRAYFEMSDFRSAQRCLEYMLKQEPGRLKGVDLLSTVYWQLKKEVELAHLAQRVVDWDRLAPEAWCVVGNCFSLQKDHESALTFFQRALQLDPDFTYTHTLCGYEYMANEDFEKAIACFRQAIRTDERHYNAWYGLGALYHRQEKFDMAEYHFERAVSLHPTSSVLRCNLGVSQYANGKAGPALQTLSEAFRLDPRNPQARFQRATIYSALHRPEDALVELEKVRDAAPREATVHFALGKVLKRLGRPQEAMKCFLTAMDLDPKDNQLIKSAMDKLDEPDMDEESMTGF